MITEETVKHLAELARIELKPEEVTSLQKDLVKILDYVEELKAVKTDGLPEVSQVTGLKNIARSDEAGAADADLPGKILEAAPASENGFVKVKAIFK